MSQLGRSGHMLQILPQISFFDNSKGQFEVCGRLLIPRSRGIPTALATITIDAPTEAARERLLYGDSSGNAKRGPARAHGMHEMPRLATGSAVGCDTYIWQNSRC